MLNRRYTKDGLADLKYVAIDIKIKDDNTEAGIYGLFLGYKSLTFDDDGNTETIEPFVWIYSKKCVYLYSLKYYNVQSIEVSLGNSGKTKEFSNFINRQPEAVESISEIMKALEEQKKIQSNGLVDVYKYEDLPSILKDHLDYPSNIVTPPANNSYIGKTTADLYKSRNDHSFVQRSTPYRPTYKPKETETFFIERTTKYSVKEALEKMKEKLKKIKDGTYQPPKLKKTLEDKKDLVDGKKDDEDDTADNEEFYGANFYGGMYG